MKKLATLVALMAALAVAVPVAAQARHGADDPVGHVRHGGDDPAGHVRHATKRAAKAKAGAAKAAATDHRGRGADDAPGDDRGGHGGHGADDGPNHS